MHDDLNFLARARLRARVADDGDAERNGAPPPPPPITGDGLAAPASRTEAANARRLIERHGADLRWVAAWNRWLVWDGRRWLADEPAAEALAKDSAAALWNEVAAAGAAGAERDVLNSMISFARSSNSAHGVRAALELARSEPGVAVSVDALDSSPWLFNTANGTLDLRTGELQPHRRDDLLTQLCPTAFDPQAEAPRWAEFLREVFDDQAELIGWLQRLLGWCLTGDVSEQLLPIFWGAGANGKSTLVNVVLDVLGEDYTCKANRDLFLIHKGDSHPAQLARLFRKRLVVCTETSEGARLDEVLVKELTGGDKIAARRMREDWWQFAPTHKAVLVTNHRPEVRGTDFAIWRRLRLVPFTVTFAADRQDTRLAEKLRSEAPGILRWLVEGCIEWQRHGLGEPAAVRTATSDYRSEQDRLAGFLRDRCAIHSELRVRVSELYSAYQEWAKANGEQPLSGQRFGRAMRERGFSKDPGDRWYLGLSLLDAEDEVR